MGTKEFRLKHAHAISHRGEGPNPIDIHVGDRLRRCRTLQGLSQEILADAIGVTFQQLQKYERGSNRISASKLFNLSEVLEVPVGFFFEGFSPQSTDAAPPEAPPKVTDCAEDGVDTAALNQRETLELVRAYRRIGEVPVRRRAFELIKALAGDAITFQHQPESHVQTA